MTLCSILESFAIIQGKGTTYESGWEEQGRAAAAAAASMTTATAALSIDDEPVEWTF